MKHIENPWVKWVPPFSESPMMPEVGLLDLRRNFATGNDGNGSLILCVPYMFLLFPTFPPRIFWFYNVSITKYNMLYCPSLLPDPDTVCLFPKSNMSYISLCRMIWKYTSVKKHWCIIYMVHLCNRKQSHCSDDLYGYHLAQNHLYFSKMISVLVGGLEHVCFPYILGMSSLTDSTSCMCPWFDSPDHYDLWWAPWAPLPGGFRPLRGARNENLEPPPRGGDGWPAKSLWTSSIWG